MNLYKLLKESQKPEIYTPGTSVMWTDEHISKKLLEIHLNPDLDLASRRESTINKTVKWIDSVAGEKNLDILDLGCGPGLYSKRFAKSGHKVTGIDFSKNSIDYAIKENISDGLDVNYRHGNYLELDENEKYNPVILIFTDLGVLLPDERELLLSKIYKSLKPGGIFIFDVINDKNINSKVSPKNWEVSDNGFWRNSPYMTLSNSFIYLEEKVILFQHLIHQEECNLETYRFWTHFFSHADLDSMLNEHEFYEREYFENVLPGYDMWSGDNVTFCVAKKRS
ncbi:MAG: class I SAM-dependent methyltransferase [Bacteroidetes bacterium]|nr:class I SAM-dependent methyltransferase [Bacteroidota bacterium]